MTMAYLSSFDLRTLGTVTLSTPGKSSIAINLATYTPGTGFALTSTTRYMNHGVGSAATGFDLYGSTLKAGRLASVTFLSSILTTFRALATTATWTSPILLNIFLDAATWRITFSYPSSLTAITFSTTETRRVFGFAASFSGSTTFETGTQLPKYIIVPVVNGASSATPVLEEAAVSSVAYSGSGRAYGLSRSVNTMRRKWVQQYENKARTFRQFAAAAPDEFTYQDLFENCRTGLPFGVYGGFGEDEFQSYMLRAGQEAFKASPASPGNPDQFHLGFDTIALGRM